MFGYDALAHEVIAHAHEPRVAARYRPFGSLFEPRPRPVTSDAPRTVPSFLAGVRARVVAIRPSLPVLGAPRPAPCC